MSDLPLFDVRKLKLIEQCATYPAFVSLLDKIGDLTRVCVGYEVDVLWFASSSELAVINVF